MKTKRMAHEHTLFSLFHPGDNLEGLIKKPKNSPKINKIKAK